MLRYVLPILIVLSACAPVPNSEVPERRAPNLNLPPMKSFTSNRVQPTVRSNAQIAQDFLDLGFMMESGRKLPFLTKFEGPIRVAVQPGAPASLDRDLSRLIQRIRNEARVPISRSNDIREAEIVIQAVPQRTLQSAVPQAACFVVPNVSTWSEFKRLRGRARTDWTRLKRREKAMVIIPSDVSPQEVRDCLHEEIAQAIGPLNDLYRLPDSTFNDDNFHTVLTGFDMLILRLFYSSKIQNGMTREQAAAVLPSLLARFNPRGQRGPQTVSRTPMQWDRAIGAALAVGTSSGRRVALASQAVKLAERNGWRDNRLAFSLFVLGRVTLANKPDIAIQSFLRAGKIYGSLYGKSIQSAHVATQMAAFALSTGDYGSAIKIANGAIGAAQRSQNAALLSTLLMIKAEALNKSGRASEASLVLRDGLAWGRYGFGSQKNLRDRLNEIRALSPAAPRR